MSVSATQYNLLKFSSSEDEISDNDTDTSANSRHSVKIEEHEVTFKRDHLTGEFNSQTNDHRGGNKISRPIVNVPTFSGFSKESITDFLDEFNRASLINGWDKHAQALLLPVYLGGRAKDFYQSLDKGVKGDIGKVWEELIKLFNSSAHRYQAKQLAYQRVQLKNESVSDYFHNLSGLVRKAWGTDTGGREKLIECFINGLRANIKKVFYNSEPKSIEEALNSAEAREIYLKSKQKNLDVNLIKNGQTDSPIKSFDKKGEEIDELRKTLDELKRKVETQGLEMKEKDKVIEKMQGGGKSLGFGNKDNNKASCWSCGSVEHFRSNCPNLRKRAPRGSNPTQ